jgi:transcriptional regulator with XRE-family HTH domain
MISDFIKKMRGGYNFSQSFLAEKIGVSRPSFSQIEKGEKELSISQGKKLADIFNISFEDFLNCRDRKIEVKILKKKEEKKKEEGIRISVPQERADKFKEVLLYILKEVGGKPNIGMTALYKLLYFIDFDYYEKYEEQLMGASYMKNHYGPTPIIFNKIVSQLEKKNKLELIKSKFYKFEQKKYLINPNYSPDLSILSAKELNHIDEELDRLSDMTAKELTYLSHKDVPWISAKQGEILDYESVFYRTKETSIREYND